MAIEIVNFPIKHGDFPLFFVCLPEGSCTNLLCSTMFLQTMIPDRSMFRLGWTSWTPRSGRFHVGRGGVRASATRDPLVVSTVLEDLGQAGCDWLKWFQHDLYRNVFECLWNVLYMEQQYLHYFLAKDVYTHTDSHLITFDVFSNSHLES